MELQERQFILDQLASSEARLLQLVDGLLPGQWTFRESPERWSIAENIEHCILFEHFILGVIAKVLQAPAEPEKKEFSAAKEPLAMGIADRSTTRFNSREVVRPTGRWLDTVEMVAELRAARARTTEYVRQLDAGLRDHFFPHVAYGDLDCYQWLIVMAQHGARHAAQIEQIKADPAYPAA